MRSLRSRAVAALRARVSAGCVRLVLWLIVVADRAAGRPVVSERIREGYAAEALGECAYWMARATAAEARATRPAEPVSRERVAATIAHLARLASPGERWSA